MAIKKRQKTIFSNLKCLTVDKNAIAFNKGFVNLKDVRRVKVKITPHKFYLNLMLIAVFIIIHMLAFERLLPSWLVKEGRMLFVFMWPIHYINRKERHCIILYTVNNAKIVFLADNMFFLEHVADVLRIVISEKPNDLLTEPLTIDFDNRIIRDSRGIQITEKMVNSIPVDWITY